MCRLTEEWLKIKSVTLVSTARRIVIRQSGDFLSGYLALNINTPHIFQTSGTTHITETVKCDKS
jgi:hypothetical protein